MHLDHWYNLYAGGIMLCAAVVIFHTYRRVGLYWATIPIIFTTYFLISESIVLGTHHYQYGVNVPLPIDLWSLFGKSPPGGGGVCDQMSYGVPLSVVLMEALLLFGIMGTTDKLKPPMKVRPLMDGFMAATLDLALDPIAAESYLCKENAAGLLEGSGTVLHEGLGIWMWFTSSGYPGQWMGIPLVNFAAWFLGAAAMSAAVRWVAIRANIQPMTSVAKSLKASAFALFLCLIVGLIIEFVLMYLVAPFYDAQIGNTGRWASFAVLFGATAALLWWLRHNYKHGAEFHFERVLTAVFMFLYMALALFFAGPWQNPLELILVYVASAFIFFTYSFSPYIARKYRDWRNADSSSSGSG